MESGSAGEWESFGSRSLWVVFGLILLPNMLIGTGLKLIICKKKSVEVKIPEWTSDTTPGNDQNLRNAIPIPKVKHSMFGCCVWAFFRVSHRFMDRCKNIFVSQSSKQSKQNNKISCFSTARQFHRRKIALIPSPVQRFRRPGRTRCLGMQWHRSSLTLWVYPLK